MPRTTELAEPGEDQPDHLLDPLVGIKAEADLAMPDVANRNADPQLTASRLRARSVEHAGTQHTEFELSDAALHTEQQPVVRPTGIVDAVHVDHPRLDQTAQLKQVVPGSAIAGEPRSVETQHGADLAGAEPRHQPLEAGPRHHPAGGAAEIVVDYLNVTETPLPRHLDKIVLPPLALEIGLDLCRRRLANIDHRLALQHRGGQEISARHRHTLRPRRRSPPIGGWPVGRARSDALRVSSRELLPNRTEC